MSKQTGTKGTAADVGRTASGDPPAGRGLAYVSGDHGDGENVRDRGKSPNRGPAADSRHGIKGRGPGEADSLGPLDAAIPPERPLQGEGHC